ncbi:hypothetical protein SLEP1_g28141 [Rubroshorea leprosula]|uniref:Uncharacterized protein n=1 Tax=Rubroshorea leprosula TaxID=152421 RepID=A0AAV5K455_9ROSI|nr:hypothetical protein SLEP1_g28141 [Rubroshorea leprosula]
MYFKEEEKRIFSEELEKLGKVIEEDLANQYFDEEIQMLIFPKDLSVTSDKFQLKDNEAFCGESGITDMFKDSEEKGEQEFKEQLNKLEEDLKKDGTLEFLSLEDPQPEMLAGNDLVRQEYCNEYGLQVPVIGGPHHDPAGMQGGTTAAGGSSGGPAIQ